MLPFETGDFYIEIFLFAISPSSLRDGPEGLFFPDSQASIVFFETPKYCANNFCVNPN